MKAISRRVFPKRNLRKAGGSVSLPKPPQAHTLRNVSRNLAWTLNFLDRLVHRSRRTGVHREPMILAHVARSYILLRTLLQQFQTVTQTIFDAATSPVQFASMQSTPTVSVSRRVETVVRQATVEPIHVSGLRARWQPVKNSGAMLAVSVAAEDNWPTLLISKPIQVLRSQPTLERRFRQTPVFSPVSERGLIQPRLSPQDEVDEPDSGALTIPAHVARKHRRVEPCPYALVHEGVALSQTMPMSSETMKRQKPGVLQRAQQYQPPGSHYERFPARSQQEPALNVSRITDEVLKQLDRRLVAARERMGRI